MKQISNLYNEIWVAFLWFFSVWRERKQIREFESDFLGLLNETNFFYKNITDKII